MERGVPDAGYELRALYVILVAPPAKFVACPNVSNSVVREMRPFGIGTDPVELSPLLNVASGIKVPANKFRSVAVVKYPS